ncbi:nucleotide sugar dehydrogenase [Streptomyces sp. NBC_00078]|uniref:nucleotide sugar dehydrogenase n=1 Tax=unclassified Streptomyces TaxID=2593676 RepID=UPI00224F3606|nr:nucleotide sugar dehydrogenase [Streptomyces sp. NBC_00078]MCX5424249.1 nucleotide sugar dehydrogenase [Streptomyces sp. NBC_00078]
MTVDLVVMGLGHVGLPLARAAVSAGLTTAGYDVSGTVVSALTAGRSHVGGVRDAEVTAMLDAGFRATADPAVLDDAQTVVICVPTGLTPEGLPDLSAVRDASGVVAARLRTGMLVVLESTSYPGTTEDVVRPLLERGSGLRVGEDFHLAYSPQRIDPGNEVWGVRNTPKIVSGCTALCVKYATAFYGRFVDHLVLARGTREAEMAKLLENTYRYVNIALADEVALFCHQAGIDVWDVLHCAASKPFGFAPFSPGPGVGGHCIPVDPRYLAARAESQGFPFRMLAAAHEVLTDMPRHVVDRALSLLTETRGRPEGARALLLGVTYKADVADVRESPARPVAAGLLATGVDVFYHDPYAADFSVDDRSLPRATDLREALRDADVAILLQDHACYAREAWGRARCAVLDTRGKAVGSRVTLL